jgi:hypothetical protein
MLKQIIDRLRRKPKPFSGNVNLSEVAYPPGDVATDVAKKRDKPRDKMRRPEHDK